MRTINEVNSFNKRVVGIDDGHSTDQTAFFHGIL